MFPVTSGKGFELMFLRVLMLEIEMVIHSPPSKECCKLGIFGLGGLNMTGVNFGIFQRH